MCLDLLKKRTIHITTLSITNPKLQSNSPSNKHLPFPIKMKVSILGLLTLSAFASACASYESCHCYDSNGVPNNGATQTVCDHFKGGMEPNTREYGANTQYKECNVKTFGGGASSFDNCDWRRRCQSAGATGADSSCRSKFP
ncbi:hypothetical protein NOF04DRAFT_18650 [Fusarium oxysporum II5]|nr:uncharacterized protein FOIG_04875 [Fusarium odoratissimum NRRL 54006]EXM04691.1 hypothetical protein FOIG_04875 [Fusarium odoratissimum NRRL 54006]KAK2126748.1 hypothetical protein NOF04DRAFT_18650 [Fusarium oxysporum II5]TXB98782.1 hypothetical protein FocTR4_00012588 [Fusarium oxysporum f. sp. cubense]